ncbi:ATP-grasp domain-containing protein [Paenibacillus apiarius]|uniref:ATP-grasp domain-containing protein n=1 Tax=Paenibacillus apiarius TaxID=46240 RepID=A0ABT4DQZ4_9BACL|nr:ATP-grasp domain-containing protein [Paenibacillus apiarius]MCY9517580.1 ATP-grasp domain-containing protein [Paenibacillus apiarius]MCY9519773.1 ATP-grasp domain-containing protein [Paenibacillus apiarius]MCY9555024.1 ATP-grasp domain-containing protein [Paenibacillus apiarius]MCY9559342.1 ATP-grasp domain-containing protein [Paenibacillus apiarius]MCY9682701.1 ATP-grasp domain-containing protein [Paenibacillus apiarius]
MCEKKIIFIESNTSGTGMLALEKAKSWGFKPVFVTNDPNRYKGLDSIPCELYITDTNDLDGLKQMSSIFDPLQIAAVVTTSEFYLITAAELALHLGLPSNNPLSLQICRNKHFTREKLKEEGFLQPDFVVVRNLEDIKTAINKIGFPCVVKPVDDSGSNDVLLCFTEDEIFKHAGSLLSDKINVRGQLKASAVLIEEYVNAPEYSVETLTVNGVTTVVGITEKQTTSSPYFVECLHVFPSRLSAEEEKEIAHTVLNALEKIDISTGAVHTEVKLTPRGCCIIEINARLAGGMIPELIRLVTGVEVLEKHIRCFAGQYEVEDYRKNGYAAIHFITHSTSGVLRGVSGIEQVKKMPLVKDVHITAKTGECIRKPKNASDRLGYVIVKGNSYAETILCAKEAVSKVELIVTKE